MAVVALKGVSRWYGNVVAVNDVTMHIGPGITGLLGPNGAGKSTLIQMMAGFLAPSNGTVMIDDQPTWKNVAIYKRIGIVPEWEGTYDALSGRSFVEMNAKLHHLSNPVEAAMHVIEMVGMTDAMHRSIAGYSKGMRQRIKVASALVHNPDVLLLDEPFNGMDPRQRLHLMDLISRMGEQGKTILFSSHILEEVQEIASNIQVMVSGRHAASGDFREVRRLMSERPHLYEIQSSENRKLASLLIERECAVGVELSKQNTLQVQTNNLHDFTRALVAIATAHKIRLFAVSPTDETLENVFSYLVNR